MYRDECVEHGSWQVILLVEHYVLNLGDKKDDNPEAVPDQVPDDCLDDFMLHFVTSGCHERLPRHLDQLLALIEEVG